VKALISALERQHGVQRVKVKDPFQQVLWENVVYLADDTRSAAAFKVLKAKVGLKPHDILRAPREALLEATRHGALAEQQATKLVACAELGADLKALVRGPLVQARKALRRFPSIGAPGADRILLLSGAHAVFSLESNGLRVLARALLGNELATYDKTYEAAMQAVAPVPTGLAWLQASFPGWRSRPARCEEPLSSGAVPVGKSARRGFPEGGAPT
jgi:endonuclease III